MVEQILGGAGNAETEEALTTTLSSLAEAAGRMGFEEVKKLLVLLRGRFEASDGTIDAAFREAVLGDLLDLKDIGEQMAGSTGAPAPPQEASLLSAIRDMEGIDDGVIGRLTAAGVVTVDQIRTGRIDEIAVVSGLDTALVERIRAHLGITPDDGASGEPQVELARISAGCDDLSQVLDDVRNVLESKVALLNQARLRSEEWNARCTAASARLERALDRMQALTEETQALTQQEATLDQEVDTLIDRLGRMRKAVSRINDRSKR